MNGSSIDLPFALFSLLSVFLNPWVWEHYYVLAIQPLFVITTEFARFAHHAYRRWSDTESSNLVFGLQALLTTVVVLALGTVAFALSRNLWNPLWYLDAWGTSREPLYRAMAYLELALKVSPWVVSILLCFIALRARRNVRA